LVPIEELLGSFIEQHILHWLEAMNLLKRFSLTIPSLDQLSDWMRNHFNRRQKSLLDVIHYWWSFSQEYETRIQEHPIELYSQELHQEFQIIQVQEPLVSRPPTLSIFDFPPSQSSFDISSPNIWSSSPTSQHVSSLSSPLDSTPPDSRPATPDVARFGRRLSRSSLSLPSSRDSSTSSRSQPASRSLSSSRRQDVPHRLENTSAASGGCEESSGQAARGSAPGNNASSTQEPRKEGSGMVIACRQWYVA
jgi:hypothetical protein